MRKAHERRETHAARVARPYVEKGLLRETMPDVFRYSNRLSLITRQDSANPALGKLIDLLEELVPLPA